LAVAPGGAEHSMATDLAMEALHDAASENRWDPPGWWRWMGWMTISMGFSDGFLVYLKWIYIIM